MQEQLERFHQADEEKSHAIEELREREQVMAQRLKEMEDKLLMVQEVLRTEDEAELKVQMIGEIVGVQNRQEAPQHEE